MPVEKAKAQPNATVPYNRQHNYFFFSEYTNSLDVELCSSPSPSFLRPPSCALLPAPSFLCPPSLTVLPALSFPHLPSLTLLPSLSFPHSPSRTLLPTFSPLPPSLTHSCTPPLTSSSSRTCVHQSAEVRVGRHCSVCLYL